MEKYNNKILITGFTPFGPYTVNLSEELANNLDQKSIKVNGKLFYIHSEIIPIDFGVFRKKIKNFIKDINPIIAIGLGMDFKDLDHLSFELVAHKKPNYSILKDSLGNSCSDDDLDDFPELIYLPNKSELSTLINSINGIELSENAGRWMCEAVLRDLIRLSDNGFKFQPCFIHLPHTKDLLEISKKFEEHRKYMDLEEQMNILLETISKVAKFYILNRLHQ